MRFVATMFLWLVTTVALAVALPAMWAQRNIVDANGYAAFAQSAAKDPRLQQAMASELTTQMVSLGFEQRLRPQLRSGARGDDGLHPERRFPRAVRAGEPYRAHLDVHRRDPPPGRHRRSLADRHLPPMLSDPSLRQTLGNLESRCAGHAGRCPITVSDTAGMQPGQLRQLSTWGPWVSIGAAILTGVLALLTLAAARARGKALAALGVSALLVGAAGWAGLEVARRFVNDALDRTSGDIRQVADAMVNHAEGSMHQWLNLTLAAGGVLVVFGVLVSMLGGLRRRD